MCDKREIKVVGVEINLSYLHEMPGQVQRGGGGTVSIHSQPGAVRRRWVFSTVVWPLLLR
jgi:hypothetical protein